MPTSAVIDVLTPIWQRVLQRPSIGPEDNFFELGGNPSSAVELFAELARAGYRELSPLTIYQAPTIAALASLLELPAAPRLSPVVPLKAGTREPPVFIAHGLGGSVMEFFQLVRHIHSRHSIYGMQTKGVDGVDKPLDRIEDMAQFYLDAIREIQPRGPYVLIGYSLGGLVTLEMARRLSENGERISLLVMVDSYPHFRYLPLGQRAGVVARRLRRYASARLQRGESRSRTSQDDKGGVPNRPQFAESFELTMRLVRDGAHRAWTDYRPRFYKGTIKFVRAEIPTEFADDAVAAWGKLASHFAVETVPGDHLGILTTHFESLDAVLSRYLAEAFGEKA